MIVMSVSSLMLASAVAERKALEKRKDDFISFASHELKTPITSLKLFVEHFEKELKTPDKKALLYVHKMNDQVNKLISLINTMLDVSKMQRGELELHREYFSLQELMEEIIDTIQGSTSHTIVHKGKILKKMYGDKERIGQVLTNLLSNAAKYSPKKQKIVVTMRSSKDKIVISVRDYGMGISKEHQKKIFDRFYRVSDETTISIPGLGIGLYLSQIIIKRHGGTMEVTSVVGKGSTFSFSLPFMYKE